MKADFLRFFKLGLKSPHVYPVVLLGVIIAPTMAILASLHQIKGPDVHVFKRFDTNEDFENKKFKHFSSIDHENYVHPRPKF